MILILILVGITIMMITTAVDLVGLLLGEARLLAEAVVVLLDPVVHQAPRPINHMPTCRHVNL